MPNEVMVNEDRRTESRREDDREWQRSVDHQLVTALTAVQVLQDQIKELKDLLRDHEITIHGEKNNRGLVAMFEAHEETLLHLKVILGDDAAGGHGLIEDVKALKGKREDRRALWGNATKIIVALIMSGFLLRFWPELMAQWNKKTVSPYAPVVVNRHYTINE